MKAKHVNFNREGTPYEKLGIGHKGIKKALIDNPPPKVDSVEWDAMRDWMENAPDRFKTAIEFNNNDPLALRDYYSFDDDYYLENAGIDGILDVDEFHADFSPTGTWRAVGNGWNFQPGTLPDGTKVIKYQVGLVSGYIAHKDWLGNIQENFGGAGYAVYGGGGRGGFGNSYGRGSGFGQGQSSGGPNLMYSYTIKPLNQVLQQPGTPQGGERYVHVGSEIKGKVLGKDLEVHGKILEIQEDDDNNIQQYVVLNIEDGAKYNVDPTSIELLSHEEMPSHQGMMDFTTIGESFYPSLMERKSIQEMTDDVKGKVERSKKIPKEMKEKIIPLLVSAGIHGSKYNDGRVTDLKIPKIPGKSLKGVGLGADKDGFFVMTHRARSKSKPEIKDIPDKDIKFIESTG